MASDVDRERFGRLLRAARENANYSQGELSAELRSRGHVISAQVISNWETGVNAPTNRGKIDAVEDVLGTGGALAVALGYAADGAIVFELDELSQLRAEVADLKKVVRRLARLIENESRPPREQ